MTGYDAFRMMTAVRLHFLGNRYKYTYDITKSGYKSKSWTLESYQRRPEAALFVELADKYPNEKDMYLFLVANVFEDPDVWAGQLVTGTKAERIYLRRLAVIQSLSSTFKREVDDLIQRNGSLRHWILDGVGEEGPTPLLNALYAKKVSPETFLALDSIFKVINIYDKYYSDDVVWEARSNIYKRYGLILNIDTEKFIGILKGILRDNKGSTEE